jgi:uncharacterized membrane protein
VKSPPSIFSKSPLSLLAVAAILFLAIAWNVSPTLPGQTPGKFYGLIFHFYGAALLTAMFGPAIALSILFPVAFLGVFVFQGWLIEAAQHYLMVCVLPTFFAHLTIQVIQKYVPKHLFVLILGNGYVAAFMSVILSGTVLLIGKMLFAGAGTHIDLEGWLLGLIIIAFMEGSLSGMLLAIFLIYRPNWVSTYNESAYMGR